MDQTWVQVEAAFHFVLITLFDGVEEFLAHVIRSLFLCKERLVLFSRLYHRFHLGGG
jgi:hypothetical protein